MDTEVLRVTYGMYWHGIPLQQVSGGSCHTFSLTVNIPFNLVYSHTQLTMLVKMEKTLNCLNGQVMDCHRIEQIIVLKNGWRGKSLAQ